MQPNQVTGPCGSIFKLNYWSFSMISAFATYKMFLVCAAVGLSCVVLFTSLALLLIFISHYVYCVFATRINQITCRHFMYCGHWANMYKKSSVGWLRSVGRSKYRCWICQRNDNKLINIYYVLHVEKMVSSSSS